MSLQAQNPFGLSPDTSYVGILINSEMIDLDGDGVAGEDWLNGYDDDGDGYSDLVEIECGSSPIRKFFIPSVQ